MVSAETTAAIRKIKSIIDVSHSLFPNIGIKSKDFLQPKTYIPRPIPPKKIKKEKNTNPVLIEIERSLKYLIKKQIDKILNIIIG